MIDLIRHHNPSIKQSSTKKVFISKYCPLCKTESKSNIFRVNLKLKVFKCYNCGRAGKDSNKFIHHLKIQKRNGYRMSRFKRLNTFEVQSGCVTLEETLLPF